MIMAIAFLLQGALGGALIIVIALVLIAAAVLVAAIFGGAVEDRGGANDGEASQTERIVPPGTILAASGLGLAVIGAFYPSISAGVGGIVCGALAYYRGARLFGGVVSIISLAAVFIGYLLGGEGYRF